VAQRIGGPDRSDYSPGLWDWLKQRQIDEVRRGDARGFGLSDLEKAKINDHPNSSVTAARAVLTGMDRGDAVLTWPPTARQIPVVADIPWLADRSCTRVWVHADDSVVVPG
jgi:hypothetical protein